jgi:hypothetical protein
MKDEPHQKELLSSGLTKELVPQKIITEHERVK